MQPVILAITPGGAQLARRLVQSLPQAELQLPERFRRADGGEYFDESVTLRLARLFRAGRPLVCIMASGIVVRSLAAELRGKALDPAVVVMDERGQFAISLLAGHLGGANELAEAVAAASGGQAVITTATDVQGLPAWDELARRLGLGVEPLAHIKRLNALLLEGGRIALVDPQQRVAPSYAGLPQVECHASWEAAERSGAAGRVYVSHRHIPQLSERPELLTLRPRDLVLGIGCNRGTAAAEIAAAVSAELERAGYAEASLACLATIDAKADEPGLLEFARARRLPLVSYSAAALNAVETGSAPSAAALAAVGARGVCEPAAILAAEGGPLLLRKIKSGNLTLALAHKQDAPTANRRPQSSH